MNSNDSTGQSPDATTVVQTTNYAIQRINAERRKASDQYTPRERAMDAFESSVSATLHAIRHSDTRPLENITVRFDVIELDAPGKNESGKSTSNDSEQTYTIAIATAVTTPTPCILAVVPVSSQEESSRNARDIATALLDKASTQVPIGRVLAPRTFSTAATVLELDQRELEYIIPARSPRGIAENALYLPTHPVTNPTVELDVDVVVDGTPQTTTDVVLTPSCEDSPDCDVFPFLTKIPFTSDDPGAVEEEFLKPYQSPHQIAHVLLEEWLADSTSPQHPHVEFDVWSVAADVNAFYFTQILLRETPGRGEYDTSLIADVLRENHAHGMYATATPDLHTE